MQATDLPHSAGRLPSDVVDAAAAVSIPRRAAKHAEARPDSRTGIGGFVRNFIVADEGTNPFADIII